MSGDWLTVVLSGVFRISSHAPVDRVVLEKHRYDDQNSRARGLVSHRHRMRRGSIPSMETDRGVKPCRETKSNLERHAFQSTTHPIHSLETVSHSPSDVSFTPYTAPRYVHILLPTCMYAVSQE